LLDFLPPGAIIVAFWSKAPIPGVISDSYFEEKSRWPPNLSRNFPKSV